MQYPLSKTNGSEIPKMIPIVTIPIEPLTLTIQRFRNWNNLLSISKNICVHNIYLQQRALLSKLSWSAFEQIDWH